MSHSALLVVDDSLLREQLAGTFSRLGWQTRTAASGQEGSVALAESPPEVVVVEDILPDTDGVTFIATMRKAGSRLPVVFVSALSRDLETFRRLTDDHLSVSLVVTKPVAPDRLAEQLASVLQGDSRAELNPVGELDLQQAMAALRHEYAQALPRKLGELAHSVYQGKARPDDPLMAAEVRGQAHRLRGTAGTYGFPEVGSAAARIEGLCGATTVPARNWTDIEQELVTAVQSLEAAEVATTALGARPASTALRVLAVDADPGFLRYLVELGRQRLVEVVPVRSAAAALEAAAGSRFEAVFLDESLPPAGSAFRLALELRSLPGLQALPLAFLSRDGQGMKNRIAAAHAGASLYACKPLDSDSFSAAVHQLSSARSVSEPHVLLVDDDPDFVAHLSVLLRHERIRLTAIQDPGEVLKVLEDSPVDLVLLDKQMPRLSGVDVCRVLRVTPRWQDLPILFITSQTSAEARTEAFNAGADDYLLKPIVREELLARIRVRIERRRLLRDRSDRDPVTGLLVRRAFISGLAPRLVEAQRHGRPLAVCLLDLDHFKQVNDRFGHLVGDRVLGSLGALLERRFRAEDLRGRWGGEEFILAFPGEGAEAVQFMVTRVLDELEAVVFTSDAGEDFHVSFSAGVSVFPDDAETVEALLRAADRRLYEAKDAGRRKVVGAGWSGERCSSPGR